MNTAHALAESMNEAGEGGVTILWASPMYDRQMTKTIDPLGMEWLFATTDGHVIGMDDDGWKVLGHVTEFTGGRHDNE